MDPNEALNRIRHAIECYTAARETEGSSDHDAEAALTEADTMVEFFQALDGWLCRRGFLPSAWQSLSASEATERAHHKAGR